MSHVVDADPLGARPSRPSPSAGRGLSSPAGRLLMLAAVVAALVGAFLGSGVLPGMTPTAEAADGWLGPDSTWLAPATPAFSIWSVIYAGLLGYGVWQTLAAAQSERQGRLRPWILASLVLNVAWLWVVQAGWLGLSVVVILLLAAVLVRVLVILETTARPRHWADRILVDGVQGLHLGWVTVATLANLTAWLASRGWTGAPLMPTTWAQVMLVLAVILGAVTAVYSGGRLSAAAALAWGLVWIGVGRADGSGPNSGAVAVTAWGSAVIVLLCWLAALWLSHRSATGEARDLILDALDGGDDPVDGVRRTDPAR
ncbi:TspO/MBR family protein [Micrococcus sp.]|uniref:TspO/MBR family protein n=1 Tax=Micrococcus sp. TaxID=1271 RepID=UPI002A9094B9|nr:TspO/MBR family protein [Micrococcus sp.]MDY6056109.1 TspO/MBR family protein [Micrococcus sp.]